ncbi:class I SAM-dependent methyltransferase [Micromonospora sp. BRA006-A]|nr:class I SAM-dependent methyltransferase [Micromonospora sp. BRA006-A]
MLWLHFSATIDRCPHRPAEPDVSRYYTEVYVEADRLDGSPQGRLEARRTRDLLARLLPAAPAGVLDVGGGPGAYAGPLAAAGYRVHLVDLVPAHVAAARSAYPLVTASVGDARALPSPGAAADATLLLGPLYHLPRQADRVAALREAARVTRPGGTIVAAAISRHAALIDLTVQGRLDDDSRQLLRAEYETGVNDPGPASPPRSSTGRRNWPPTSSRPDCPPRRCTAWRVRCGRR